MALTAIGAQWQEISPQAWMKGVSFPLRKGEVKRARKLRMKAMAQQLFPDLVLWSQPKTQGKQLAVCDALLIAEYCRRWT
jgi:hypothetical protein